FQNPDRAVFPDFDRLVAVLFKEFFECHFTFLISVSITEVTQSRVSMIAAFRIISPVLLK
ncbi:hypothetical protein, partial [Faecalibaculum rodentium]|uniref:hypothetical protein n=1 Tax=Faecalibaculum rodentium TaxID=1702221 RepID=UPI00248FD2D4